MTERMTGLHKMLYEIERKDLEMNPFQVLMHMGLFILGICMIVPIFTHLEMILRPEEYDRRVKLFNLIHHFFHSEDGFDTYKLTDDGFEARLERYVIHYTKAKKGEYRGKFKLTNSFRDMVVDTAAGWKSESINIGIDRMLNKMYLELVEQANSIKEKEDA